MNWLSGMWNWIDDRLPVQKAWDTHMAKYYAPKNFNFWYFFGVLSLVVLVIQLGTGVWLLMSYEGTAEGAFASVEYIMRDVELGWIIRYMHSTGASAFFIVVYMHMFRGLLYGSYRPPRELIWIFGMAIYVALMAEAFLGYVLPWGQMSYWGAQVIISLFGAVPLIGDTLVEWIRGDYLISGITLNRFMSLHVVAVPIILIALVVLHILALHHVGSNNPDGIDIKKNKDENGIPRDGIPFHPYYTVHDLMPIVVFLFIFCTILFFFPEMGGYFIEHANFEEANPLKTPEHIAPVWYFTPYYSMLRAVPDKLGGFMCMAAAIAILFVLPWLDRSPVRSIRYKGMLTKVLMLVFAANFIILGILGVKSPTEGRTLLAQICTVYYFAFFLLMPFWSKWDKTKPLPERVTMQGLGLWTFFKGAIVVGILVALPVMAVGAEAEFDCGTISCEHMDVDPSNKESLQSGAKWYMNYCFGCHSLKYSRYERVAADLKIPESIAMQTLVFGDQKIGDLMEISMTVEQGQQWFGVAPPDLTLVSRLRSPDWVYTYLKNFYADPNRPWGVNNKVFPDVGMPHVMMEVQGLQECRPGPVHAENGGIKTDPLTNQPLLEDPCGAYEVVSGGSMSAEEFDQVAYDIANFLAYTADPVADKRREIGTGVLLFLAFLFVLVWLLNREYWRELH